MYKTSSKWVTLNGHTHVNQAVAFDTPYYTYRFRRIGSDITVEHGGDTKTIGFDDFTQTENGGYTKSPYVIDSFDYTWYHWFNDPHPSFGQEQQSNPSYGLPHQYNWWGHGIYNRRPVDPVYNAQSGTMTQTGPIVFWAATKHTAGPLYDGETRLELGVQ